MVTLHKLAEVDPVMMFIVVVFPAPCGPGNPAIAAFTMENIMSSTVFRSPFRLVKSSTLIKDPSILELSIMWTSRTANEFGVATFQIHSFAESGFSVY